jgi:hypothetical protein
MADAAKAIGISERHLRRILQDERVMEREKLPEFLKEVTGKDDLSALTWLEAATVIAQLQKTLKAKRAKEPMP